MRRQEDSVDRWLVNKEEEMLDRNTEFWDFLPDTLILPDDWERSVREGFQKKPYKLGLLAQPLLTPTYLRNLGPLNRYIFFMNSK